MFDFKILINTDSILPLFTFIFHKTPLFKLIICFRLKWLCRELNMDLETISSFLKINKYKKGVLKVNLINKFFIWIKQ